MTDAPQTYWNGESCKAERCTVVVADNPEVPAYWARPFVGTERQAVMVGYHGATFYIDDEGYAMSEDEAAALRGFGRQAQAGDQVGFAGWGWKKVTEGRGGPSIPHASLAVERIVSTAHDQAV